MGMKLPYFLKRTLFLGIFFVVPFFFCHDLHADTSQASPPFQQGIIASKQGNYAEALTLFQQAEAAGLDKPALYYNIGVCSYKLGRYAEAEKAFRKTATFPQMAPLAYYNLGVVAEKQSDHENALYWLEKSYSSAAGNDEKLRILAANAVQTIKGKMQSPHWDRYVSLGLGYDDNVELVADNDILQASNQEDGFLDLFVYLRRPLGRDTSTAGSYLQSNISYLKYYELDEYDTGSASLEFFHWRHLGNYQLEGGGGYEYVLLEGNSYEQSPMISLQVKRPLWASSSLRLRYRLNYLDILDDDYDYLAGWRQRAMAELSRKWGDWYGYLAYTLELNDRDDEDYSPTRHSIAAGMNVKFLKNMGAAFYVSYRDSCYDIAAAEDRDEEQLDASASLSYYLPNGWEIACKLQNTHNESNDPAYDYIRNAVTVSVARFF
jgi:hypothetical protein